MSLPNDHESATIKYINDYQSNHHNKIHIDKTIKDEKNNSQSIPVNPSVNQQFSIQSNHEEFSEYHDTAAKSYKNVGSEFWRDRKLFAYAKFFHIYFFGLGVALGGNVVAWNIGLSAGFGSFIISITIIAAAYICFSLCLAELVSAIPFCGGSFGKINCTPMQSQISS
jgi:hypothetical protein